MFTALVLQSCAVLTVDVDVYKGPLANHEDVQTEQLAAMVVAARPLLVQLRDDLECGRRCGVEGTYVRGRMFVHDDNELTDESAKVVNAVLSLYLDKSDLRRGSSPLSRHIERGRTILAECVRLKSVLTEWRDDGQLAAAVESDSKSRAQTALLEFTKQHRIADLAAQLDSQRSTTDALAQTNLDFERLTDRKRFAAWLDNQQVAEPLKTQLIDRAASVGEAYVQGRAYMDEAVELTLTFLDEVLKLDLPGGKHDQVISQTAEILRLIVQPKSLYVALTNARMPAQSKNWLTANLGQIHVQRLAITDDWSDDDYRLASRAIAQLVRQDPRAARDALYDAHRSIRSYQRDASYPASPTLQTYEATQQVGQRSVQYPRQRYGIARALTISPAETTATYDPLDLERLAQTLDSVLHALGDALGLGQGRPDEGLITIVDKYIAIWQPASNASDEQIDDTTRDLIDALVHFAEKLLFIANHDIVLHGGDSVSGREQEADRKRERYVMVLESVGNSILTLNDELQQSWDHQETDKDKRASRELRAAQSAWRTDPATSFDDLTRAVLGKAVIPDSLLAAERKTWLDAAAKREQKKTALVKSDGELATAKAAQEKSAKAEADAKAEHERLKTSGAPAADIEAAAKKHQELLGTKQTADARVTTATATASTDKTTFETAVTDESNAKSAYDALVAALKTKSAELIQAARTSVLGSVTKDPVKPSRERVVGALTAELLERASKASGAAQTDLKAAADLAAAQPLTDLPDVNFPIDPKKPTEVLDQIAATLRNARIAAKAQGLEAVDENLEQALELAESYRSPMVYIRPPASFLRNSSPVSTLQDNQVGWRNMLTEVARGSFSGEPTREQRERLETQTAIDRQFWQNINRVRVTGTGDTTYALVKDDIGNWYVKGYKGDPEKVIKGVQAMALTAVSGAMNADVLKHAGKLAQAQVSGETLATKTSPTVLGKQVDHFEKLYDDATENDAKELKDATDASEPDSILAKVKDSLEKLVTDKPGLLLEDAKAVAAAVDDAAKAAFETKPTAVPADKGAKQAEFCADLLKRVAEFEVALLARLDAKQLVDATTVDQPRKNVAGKEGELAVKKSEQAAAEQNLATLQELEQAATAPTDIDARIVTATERLTKAKGDVGTAESELANLRATLTDAEAKVAQARALVLALRRSTIEIVGGRAQKFVDRRADAVEDYQTALQVLGQRPSDDAAAP